MPLIKLYYFSYYYYCSKGLHAPLWASLTAKQTWNCTFIAVIMRRALVLAMYLSDPSPTITALPVLFPVTFYIIAVILINVSGMARCENVHHNYPRGFSLKKTRNAKRRRPQWTTPRGARRGRSTGRLAKFYFQESTGTSASSLVRQLGESKRFT